MFPQYPGGTVVIGEHSIHRMCRTKVILTGIGSGKSGEHPWCHHYGVVSPPAGRVGHLGLCSEPRREVWPGVEVHLGRAPRGGTCRIQSPRVRPQNHRRHVHDTHHDRNRPRCPNSPGNCRDCRRVPCSSPRPSLIASALRANWHRALRR